MEPTTSQPQAAGEIQHSAFGSQPPATPAAPQRGGAPKPLRRGSTMRDVRDFRIERVNIGTEFYVHVRDLPWSEAMELARTSEDVNGGNQQENAQKMIDYILRATCNEDGSRFFDVSAAAEDREWVASLSYRTVMEWFRKILAVNGLSAEGIEDEKGN